MSLSVEMQRRVRTWAPPRADIAAWASTALGRRAAGRELGVSVVGSRESRRLNARYRGRDKPTNVLSFPAPELPPSVSTSLYLICVAEKPVAGPACAARRGVL